MIHVVGGCYREVCMSPEVTQFYGSAGRAATALAARTKVRLHTFVGPRSRRDVQKLAALGGFELSLTSAAVDVTFGYVHPLQSSYVSPIRGSFDNTTRLHIDVPGEVAVVFGTFEGQASATAGTIVYDPQDGIMPVPYRESGCAAQERLAILLNTGEALRTAETDDIEAAGKRILQDNAATVVIIKSGPRGALVFERGADRPVDVPAFFSKGMFGIGSGDFFAAAFAYYWGECREAAAAAAEKASRSVSHYVETRSDRLASDEELAAERRKVAVTSGQIYLAGPFFTMAQRWLIEETRDQFLQLGLDVFSPVHQVGRGPAETVAPLDLQGLEQCDRVFAIADGLDSGTIFEIGYARKMGIPVYCYGETIDPENSKMITGSGCRLIGDYATSVYHAAWRC